MGLNETTFFIIDGVLNAIFFLLVEETGENDTRTQYMCYMRIMIIVFSATFNSISVISWRSVLLVEETGENHRSASSH
jgi:hypothetical protein